MPHFLSENKVVVTRDELVPEFYSWDQLKKQLLRYKDKPYGVKRAQRGCRGMELLIDYDSLPNHVKEALPDPRKTENPLEPYFEVDQKAVEYYTSYQPIVGKSLDPDVIGEYITNASVLNATIRLLDARLKERIRLGIGVRGVNTTIYNDAMLFNTLLLKRKKRQHTLPSNERRFIQRMKSYQETGYEDLISKLYNNKNSIKVDDTVGGVLNSLFVQKNKPTMAEVHRQYEGFLEGYVEVISQETGEMYDPGDFPKLSDATIRRWLSKWSERIATHLNRAGDRQKYMTRYSPFQSLEQPKYAGSIISIDDRQPPFWYDKNKRLWFYNGIDVGSEAFTCWVWGKTKEGLILEFYRQMVRNYAEWGFSLPWEIECESSLNSTLKDTILQEGNVFQKVRIEANKARAKRIEQYYRQLRYAYEKGHEGWLARPHALDEANQRGEETKIIPYPELVEQCLGDIQRWNNTEHSKIKGKTRWEVFLECQHPELKPINYQMILPYLGYKQESSVNAGQIRFRNTFFVLGLHGVIQTGEVLIQLMKQVEGKGIDIYWLDDNDGGVLKALAYMDGRYVCDIIRKPKPNRSSLERTEEDEQNFELMERYRATVEGYARDKKNAIEKVVIVDNRTTTLNDKFKIRGLKQMPVLAKMEYEDPEEDPEDNEFIPGLNLVETKYNSTLKETY